MQTLNYFRKKIYIGLSFAALAAIALFLLIASASPYTGLTLERKAEKWIISHVDAHSPASSLDINGKEVTAIAGWRLWALDLIKSDSDDELIYPEDVKHFWAAKFFLSDKIRPGVPMTLTAADGLSEMEYQIVPERLGLLEALSRVWVYLLAGGMFLLTGLIVKLKKPQDRRANVYFWLSLASFFVYSTYGIILQQDITLIGSATPAVWLLHFFSTAAGGSLLLHFCLVFPSEKKITRWRLYRPLLTAYPFAATACFVFSTVPHNIWILLTTSGVVISILHSAFTVRSPLERSQIKWVLYSIAVSVSFFIFFLLAALFGFKLYDWGFMLVISILIPVSFSFSILKYRLMDIDSLIDNTLVYATTVLALSFIDAGIVAAVIKLGNLDIEASRPFAVFFGLLMIVFVYAPLRGKARQLIRRLLKRECYDINQVSMELGNELLSVRDVSGAVRAALSHVEKALGPKGTKAFTCEGELPSDINAVDVIKYFRTVDLKAIKSPVHFYSICKDLPANLAGGAFVPLSCANGPAGFIILEEKHSGRLYDAEDFRLLKTLASQLSMAIEAIRYRHEAERREKESLEEKERLSREVHDGIGSSFVRAIMLTDSMVRKTGPAHADGLGDLKDILSEGLTELRELIWSVDQEESTAGCLGNYLADKANQLNKSGGIECRFNASIYDDEFPLSSLIRLNMIRIAQEAFTNIIKHSGATHAYIDLCCNNETISIRIRDDGKGFTCPDFMNKGHGLGNLRRRCEALGGAFKIGLGEFRGVELTAELPLKKED